MLWCVYVIHILSCHPLVKFHLHISMLPWQSLKRWHLFSLFFVFCVLFVKIVRFLMFIVLRGSCSPLPDWHRTFLQISIFVFCRCFKPCHSLFLDFVVWCKCWLCHRGSPDAAHQLWSHICERIRSCVRIKRVAKATQKDQTVFESLSYPLLEGQISVNDSWPDLTGILDIVSISLYVILTIACTTLFDKVRTLTAALPLLQKISKSQSFTLTSPFPSFIYKYLLQTTSSENIQNIFNTQCNPWPFVLLSAITAITLMTLVIHLYRKLNNNNHTHILLEITNGLSYVAVPIVTLPLCPTDWDIIIPDNLSNMRISGTFVARLHAQWPVFFNNGHQHQTCNSYSRRHRNQFLHWFKTTENIQNTIFWSYSSHTPQLF